MTGLVIAATPIASFADEPQSPKIAVQGVGTITLAPDMARISIGVRERAATAAEAMASMNAALETVLQKLKDEGIAEHHLQTGGLRLQQYSELRDNTRQPAGYEAHSDLKVEVNDLSILGSVLDTVVREGANQLRGLTFGVQDRAPHLAAARELAVKNAQSKAMLYARAASVELGRVLLISEFTDAQRPLSSALEAPVMMADTAAVPIAEGTIDISAKINMVWALD